MNAQREYSPRVSPGKRAELHKRLDELLDLDEEINEVLWHNGVSEKLPKRLAERTEGLAYLVSKFSSQIAGGDARAVAFRHQDPSSREALGRFLKCVANYAAPYHYTSANFGIETFTWCDVMAVLEDLQSLDFGDIPARLVPADKNRKRAAKYSVLREQWRAIRWVSYLEAKHSKEAAVREVAMAYGVSDRTIYKWRHTTSAIKTEQMREQELKAAKRSGEELLWPDFTLSQPMTAKGQSYRHWLEHDARLYNSLVKAGA